MKVQDLMMLISVADEKLKALDAEYENLCFRIRYIDGLLEKEARDDADKLKAERAELKKHIKENMRERGDLEETIIAAKMHEI